MNDAERQAEKLFSRCFTKPQLEFLRSTPEFVEATRTLASLKEAVHAVEVGDKLVRRSWTHGSKWELLARAQ